jgi:hypothetical protein
LKPDEEVEFVQNHKPIARIFLTKSGASRFGSCKGIVKIIAEDVDRLKDLEECML